MNKIQDANLTRRGRGRPKGSPNKVSAAIKEMVVQALNEAGGVDYLIEQAKGNPTAFLTLVGKVLPLQVDADVNAKVVGTVVFKGLNG
jgi:hypothetical protein